MGVLVLGDATGDDVQEEGAKAMNEVMARETMTKPELLVTKHERCACGYCRCQHASGYGAGIFSKCVRYTWPGNDASVKNPRCPEGNA